ncbi:MAG: hypothetical protein E7536_01020 [Ruminococcaceae bacterium]|nr:hypothetical protein [Oscillospiraceae bacterium]
MKKKMLAVVSVIMCAVMLLTPVSVSADAGTDAAFKAGFANVVSDTLNALIDFLLDGISSLLPPTMKIKDPSTHSSENFLAGNDKFIDAPAEGAKWSIGYASASILPDDFSEGKYYKGGYDINLQLSECIDDLKVRLIAMDDGSGRGISILAAVDCLGLANDDVRDIRAAVIAALPGVKITSINVSATHVHSGIDTQGIYTNTFGHVFQNLFSAFFGFDWLCDPVDTKLLKTIADQTAACAKLAVADMKTGTLTYSKTNIDDYVRDRTNPDIMIDYMYRLMFTPDDGSKGTILANFGCHPETTGYGTQIITADFVYYTEEVINEAGYNFIYIQGAVGTYTEDQHYSNDGLDMERADCTTRYGQEIGYILLAIGMTEEEIKASGIIDEEREALAKDSEGYTPWYEGGIAGETKVVEPILNVKLTEYLVPVENGVYRAFGKLSLANNVMYEDKDGNIVASTEVGYMELGKDLKIVLCPGETYAELIVGGPTMEGFKYKSAYEMIADENDEILVFDLVNDALGYIMADDDFVYLRLNYDAEYDELSFGDSWGLTSIGGHAASDIYGKFYELYDSVRDFNK